MGGGIKTCCKSNFADLAMRILQHFLCFLYSALQDIFGKALSCDLTVDAGKIDRV